MNRILAVLLIAAVVGTAGFLYDVKFHSMRLSKRVEVLARDIERERDAIAILKAEWSYLNQPARLQQLVSRHFKDMKTVDVNQMVLAHELPERPLDLGLFIDQLGPEGEGFLPIPVPVPKPAYVAPSRVSPVRVAPVSASPVRVH